MSDRKEGKIADILLVEDDPGDVALMREVLEDSKFSNNIDVVGDGIEATKYLRREPPYEDVPRPDLILLDLNLPRKDGREVLADIKQDVALRSIPTIVLTTSASEQDVLRSYDLHANAYVTKPLELDRFLEIAQTIENFYIAVVRLPPK